MRQHRILARWFASLLVVGTVAAGAVAPAEAAGATRSQTHVMQLKDTGWGGT